MSLLVFLGQHWLMSGGIVAFIVACVLFQPLGLAVVKFLVGLVRTPMGRRFLLCVAIAVVLAIVEAWSWSRGHAVGVTDQAQTDAKLIEQKNTALGNAVAALDRAYAAMDKINAEAQKEIAIAKGREQDANRLGKAYEDAATAANLSKRNFDHDLQVARANPTCEALMNADRFRICGL